tara:strand:- start:256 stop:462 length:207 start_codon:yes stop_codon:yes gene_type:complete
MVEPDVGDVRVLGVRLDFESLAEAIADSALLTSELDFLAEIAPLKACYDALIYYVCSRSQIFEGDIAK